MSPIHFSLPTQVFLETDAVAHHAALFARGKKAMIVTGRTSAKRNGAQDDVVAALAQHQIPYVLYDAVPSNPGIATCYEGARLAKESGADFVIAIGGGSPMDAGKAIALLAASPLPRDQLFTGPYTAALPLIHIPTTSGTGSEVTPYAILSDDEAQTKRSIATPLLFPQVALLDPKYQAQLPHRTTVNTALDALSHNIESMLSARRTPLISALAASGIRAFAETRAALADGTLTMDDRTRLLYASLTGGIAIAHTATNIVHALGYSLTYFRHIDHGRANALTLATYLDFLEHRAPGVTAPILSATGQHDLAAFHAMIDALIGKKEPFTTEEIDRYVPYAFASKNSHGAIIDTTREDLRALYQDSLLA